MAKVRLRDTSPAGNNGHLAAAPVTLTPLRVSGIVVDKAALVAALRVYVPALREIQVTDDGQYFWLMLDDRGTDDDSDTAQAVSVGGA